MVEDAQLRVPAADAQLQASVVAMRRLAATGAVDLPTVEVAGRHTVAADRMVAGVDRTVAVATTGDIGIAPGLFPA